MGENPRWAWPEPGSSYQWTLTPPRGSSDSRMLRHECPGAGPALGVRHSAGCPLPTILPHAQPTSGTEEALHHRNTRRMLSAGRPRVKLHAPSPPGSAHGGNPTLNGWKLLSWDGKETEDVPRQHLGFVTQVAESKEGKNGLRKGPEVSLLNDLKQDSQRGGTERVLGSQFLAQRRGWEAQAAAALVHVYHRAALQPGFTFICARTGLEAPEKGN